MSVIVQPIAYLCFLSTVIRFSSCQLVKLDATITGRVSYSPRYTYLRCLGKLFSSKEGDDPIGGGVKLIGS